MGLLEQSGNFVISSFDLLDYFLDVWIYLYDYEKLLFQIFCYIYRLVKNT